MIIPKHTCCCFEAGCAAGYKGLNDCIDVQKNSTDAVTSVTDVATTRLTTTAGISAIVQSNAKEQTSTPAKKSPTTLTEGAPAATTRKSTESPTSSVKQQDSTETTITVLHPVTSRVQTASTSSTVPGTTTYYIPTRAIMKIFEEGIGRDEFNFITHFSVRGDNASSKKQRDAGGMEGSSTLVVGSRSRISRFSDCCMGCRPDSEEKKGSRIRNPQQKCEKGTRARRSAAKNDR
nr:unnamed protein product [Haemonchus contortus]